MSFINKNFILNNQVAQDLYHNFARDLPIIDYHCHLEPSSIAENNKFDSIYDLWLAGDHYKWRAMRANGIHEQFITGEATPLDKFKAWSETIEFCLGNPLYHWSHLELNNYFGITETLNSENYQTIWNECNSIINKESYSPQSLIRLSNVEIICTTDSPLDDLESHKQIASQADFSTRVLPTFRPDDALTSEGQDFAVFVSNLASLTSIKINNFDDFLEALENRVQYFHDNGCRISDHGLTSIEYSESNSHEQNILFEKKINCMLLTEQENIQYRTAVLLALARFYKKRNWSMQIHFGVIRNNNKSMLRKVGINSGFDSICDQTNLAVNLNKLFNAMNDNDCLPNIIVYNLNPSVNDVVATTIANFQKSGSVKSNMQFGSGWWFSDTKRGMERQLTTLADHGLLMNFIGMLTDSRSFLSYTRHEYFRRILCGLIGKLVNDGEIPKDYRLLERLIVGICYKNAKNYFNDFL